MFKKPENIRPLPDGMVDAFTAKVSSQGYKMPEAEPVVEAEVEVEAQPEEVSEAVASRGADKTKPGDGDTKMPKVADAVSYTFHALSMRKRVAFSSHLRKTFHR